MPARKPKFVGKKTKWEKKRIVKRHMRKAAGKKPVVEPLVIAPVAERNAALKEGKMAFYDGKERIEVKLFKGAWPGTKVFQGIYKLEDGHYVVLRDARYGSAIFLFELKRIGKEYCEIVSADELFNPDFVVKSPDLSHMRLRENMRGKGLALKAVSKGERSVRATQQGGHAFRVLEGPNVSASTERAFKGVFSKLGYHSKGSAIAHIVEKKGRHQPKDDLGKFHRIEAIDPKTGKARIFTFPIRKYV
ncbi:MAG: hypothetical protein JW772_03865 [Candidatus Diapherotrites archaeon]|nr:hypothetical protein [Candidatus Diapherotrites archaeon]